MQARAILMEQRGMRATTMANRRKWRDAKLPVRAAKLASG